MARSERGLPRGKPLGRATGRRAPKDLIVVWMEGENTEAGWVDHLIQRAADVAIDLQILSHPGEGVPNTLVSKAKRSRGAGVEVWVVFDRDEHDLTTALNDARDAGLGVVFSNPCFELWPLLHLQGRTRPEHRHDLQRALHQAHPSYHHDRGANVDWEQLAAHLNDATRRALGLHTRSPDPTIWTAAPRDSSLPTGVLANPSTTAWLLHLRCVEPGFGGSSDDPLATDHMLVTAILRDERLAHLLGCCPPSLRQRVIAALPQASP
jgi:hypothetical protein